MNPVEVLMDEHAKIAIELDELDFIMDRVCDGDEFCRSDKQINYSNLVHTFWKVCKMWDNHEAMEEEIFGVMAREGFEIPIEAIKLEHKKIRTHVERISWAINSGSDLKMRQTFVRDLSEFVKVLRKHSQDEEDALIGVIVDDFSEVGLDGIKVIVGRYAGG